MASTSHKARVIFKEHTDTGEATDFAGTYKLLVRSKSMPAPVSAPNTVESTTLEDDAQTYEMGIKTSDSKEITGNLEKEYLDAIDDLEGEKLILCSFMEQKVSEKLRNMLMLDRRLLHLQMLVVWMKFLKCP